MYSLHMQCSTNELCYIQDFKSDHVLDLEHEPNGSVCKSNGAAAVFNPKADPPTDSQQWYLHPLSNGHYLVVSKLHGKVLTYQIDEEGHRKCFVSNSSGGQDQQRQDQQRQDQQRQDQQRQDQQRQDQQRLDQQRLDQQRQDQQRQDQQRQDQQRQDQQRLDQQRQDQQRQDQQRPDQQWMKKEDSVVSVKYDFPVGKCVDI